MKSLASSLLNLFIDRVYMLCRLMLIVAVPVFGFGLFLIAVKLPGLFYLVLGLWLVAVIRGRQKRYTAYGTARWASAHDLSMAGMLGAAPGAGRGAGAGRGPILGRIAGGPTRPSFFKAFLDLFRDKVPSKIACEQFVASIRFGQKPGRPNPELVRLPNAVHTAVFAPTGVGKGVSCIVPFLQTCDESAVVVDFKGENFRLTAEHRRRAFGHRIVVLDPFGVVSGKSGDCFNPLDFIDRDSPRAIDDCRDLSEAMVVRTGQEKDPHWCDSAEAWISSLIALVVYYGEPNDRSLQTVRNLLSNPEKLAIALKLMCDSDAWNGMLSRMGNQLKHFQDKELNSTMTTTNRFLRFLDTLAIAENTRSSSFNPADLLGGKVTAYLVLPPEHMRSQSPLLRLWIGSLLRAVVRGGLQDRKRVHFVLDESSSLGNLAAIDDAVDKYRGYGVRLQFYYQSMGQLKKCFPEGQDLTLLSNVTQTFFGVNDYATAEYVSNRLGESTIIVASGGTSNSTSRQTSNKGESSIGHSTTTNDNWAQMGRKLLKPEEVLALPERIAVTFTPGVPPIQTTLVRYYEESLLLLAPGAPGAGVGDAWKRFGAMAHLLKGSLVLLLGASMLVLIASGWRLYPHPSTPPAPEVAPATEQHDPFKFVDHVQP